MLCDIFNSFHGYAKKISARVIGDPFDWQLLLINNGRDWLDTLDTACGKRTNHGELYESCYITEGNTGFPAITAPRLQTIKQTLTTSNNEFNLLTVTFLTILKWTAINLRWLFVDGSVKQAKDWWLPLTFRSEIYVQRWAGKKSGPWAVS